MSINRQQPTTFGFQRATVITPTNNTDIALTPRGLLFGTTGNAVLRFVEQTTDVTIPVLAGVVYYFEVSQVQATGHTAGTVIALN